MGLKEISANILHPAPYVRKQINPVIKSNTMSSEVVWTYLVARKYQNDMSALVNKLCGQEEILPQNAKIWLEVYLSPTRIWKEELKSWRTRADLAVGYIEPIAGKDAEIGSNGDWICIAESKWFDDIHRNSKYPEIYQLSQLIEHAVLLHNRNGDFPGRIYVTLITPKYFKDQMGKFSERNYWKKYRDYSSNRSHLEKDLKLCPLPFQNHDLETLLQRIESLTLSWVTFEELLGLSSLVEDRVPGKYRTTMETWEQVCKEIHREDLFVELSKKRIKQ
jgi:hypothetical protein